MYWAKPDFKNISQDYLVIHKMSRFSGVVQFCLVFHFWAGISAMIVAGCKGDQNCT